MRLKSAGTNYHPDFRLDDIHSNYITYFFKLVDVSKLSTTEKEIVYS